jgi:hypothetical protein
VPTAVADYEAEFRTRWLGNWSFTLDDVLPSGGGGPGWFMRWLRPAVTVRTPFGTWTKAPAGDPGASLFPVFAVVAGVAVVGTLGLAVVGAVSLTRSR